MEKNEISGIPDHDVVVSPDDSDDLNDPVVSPDDPDDPDDPNDPVVSTDYVEKKGEKTKLNQKGKRKPVQKHQPNDSIIIIKQLEQFLGAAALKSLKNFHKPVREGCIYKVPRDLRDIDTKAYTPQVISIGPFHHGKNKTQLGEMEKQKVIYMSEFLKREGLEKGAENLKGFNEYIEDKEKIIRNYYGEYSALSRPQFVKMILRDAVFIIEYFLKNAEPIEERKFDFFLDTPYVKAAITRDLQLFENQLPYFLLKDLFEEGAFLNFTKEDYPNRRDRFLILCHQFFFNSKNDDFPEPNDQIQHFTDLRRRFLLMDFLPGDQNQGDQNQGEKVRDLPTATKLHGSGVKFKGIERERSRIKKGNEGGSSRIKKGIERESSRINKGIEGGSSLKISCELVPRFTCKLRIPCFNSCQLPIRIPYLTECVLRIPCIEIDDWSECLYRNMMALELCQYPNETHICNFILLMDFLIDTEKDMDLLVDQGIIFSRLGDNATAATMFNNLSFQITPSHSVYHDICNKLKEHYDRGWNRTMATLNTVYFGDIWTGTKTVAAVILLVLTSIQTVYSIL